VETSGDDWNVNKTFGTTLGRTFGNSVSKTKPTCPWCGSANIEEEWLAATGVGLHRVYSCGDCWALEMNPYSDNEAATPEERKRGWWSGPPTRLASLHPSLISHDRTKDPTPYPKTPLCSPKELQVLMAELAQPLPPKRKVR
jgi:hypothetical protein